LKFFIFLVLIVAQVQNQVQAARIPEHVLNFKNYRHHLNTFATSDYVSNYSNASLTVEAMKYQLYFNVDAVVGTADVIEVLHLRQSAPTLNLQLDANYNLAISELAVNGEVRPFTQKFDMLSIPLSGPQQAAPYLDIEIHFHVNTFSGMEFSRDDFGKVLTMQTTSEPMEARTWFVGVDRPGNKALFETSVEAPADWKTLSNGRLTETRIENGRSHYSWQMEAPMSTYLFSLVSGPLEIFNAVSKRVPIAFWYLPVKRQNALNVLRKTPKMVDLLSRTLIPYPYNKYHVSLVDFPGAMEHLTATTLGEEFAEGDADDSRSGESVAFHELSHQWFGDTVTCRNWDDLWLHEGFANFFEFFWQREEYGMDSYNQAISDQMNEYFTDETSNFSLGPVVNSQTLPNDKFTSASYDKPALVLNMLMNQIGDQKFFTSLRTYLKAHFMGNAETADFQKAVESVVGRSFEEFFQQWIYRAGFPDVRVTVTENATALTVTVDQKQPDRIGTFSFSLPVDMKFKDGSHSLNSVWVSQKSQSFDIPKNKDVNFVVIDPSYSLLMRREIQMPDSYWRSLLSAGAGTINHRAEAMDALSKSLDQVTLLSMVRDEKLFVKLRAKALLICASQFPAAMPEIKTFLSSPIFELRKAAVTALVYDRNSIRTFGVASSKLRDPSELIAAEAAVVLAKSNQPGALDLLAAELKKNRGGHLISTILMNMASIHDPRSVDLISNMLSSNKSAVRSAAAMSLSLTADPRISEILGEDLLKEIVRPDVNSWEFAALIAKTGWLISLHNDTTKKYLEEALKMNIPIQVSDKINSALAGW